MWRELNPRAIGLHSSLNYMLMGSVIQLSPDAKPPPSRSLPRQLLDRRERGLIYVTEAGEDFVRLLQTGSVSEANRLVGC